MANTLEQFVWLAVCLLALATLLQPDQMRLIPIACVFFVAAAACRDPVRKIRLRRQPLS